MTRNPLIKRRARLRADILLSGLYESEQHLSRADPSTPVIPPGTPAQLGFEGRLWAALGYTHSTGIFGYDPPATFVIERLDPQPDRLDAWVALSADALLASKLGEWEAASDSDRHAVAFHLPDGTTRTYAPHHGEHRPVDVLLGLVMRRIGVMQRRLRPAQIDGWARTTHSYLLELTFPGPLPDPDHVSRAVERLSSRHLGEELKAVETHGHYLLTSPLAPGAELQLRLISLDGAQDIS